MTFIFGYVNPDTDGVCSSIGYARLKHANTGGAYVPIIFGSLNDETKFVLDAFQISAPECVTEVPEGCDVILVDTHHPSQLPSNLNLNAVVEIMDHHPGGAPDSFRNAIIQNEAVGAAATLITEKARSSQFRFDRSIAGILLAAIISNTSNLLAPSTTYRDVVAADWLRLFVSIDDEFIRQMYEASAAWFKRASTAEILASDYKAFDSVNGSIGISQIETLDAAQIISREDLLPTLAALKVANNVAHIVLNIIDRARAVSIIVTPDVETQALLMPLMDGHFVGGLAIAGRFLLRKTDLFRAF